MNLCLSKAVLPVAPELFLVDATPLPSYLTFVVNPSVVHSPQTSHPWFVEMDHEMGSLNAYSLIPQPSNNQYVTHYHVENRMPRFLGKFQFSDAWLTTRCRLYEIEDLQFYLGDTFFHPSRADDKLYFDQPPVRRMEILVPGRFIGDRELLDHLEPLLPTGCEIRSLVQRQSSTPPS